MDRLQHGGGGIVVAGVADGDGGAVLGEAFGDAAADAAEKRLSTAKRLGELPAAADPTALARYFGAVLQGMSQRSRDGADTAELTATAELAMAAWPVAGTGTTAS
ncbi:hypothetical protein [Kitasatospora griseola]|uniref:hypothetical protein n=1 Tax=Kitasatospora griseola TaxID=2064 RepID=UPI003996AC67